jgi:TM2 domain-containing membrane protein YozV
MNCANHQETAAVAYCRDCGKPMCSECERPALGSIYCAEHAPVLSTAAPEMPAPAPSTRDYRTFAAAEPLPPPPPSAAPESPYTAPAYSSEATARQCDVNSHPVLALLLGFIPGVGAIYNGQYAKGLIHAIVFGMLVTITSRSGGSFEPLLGILIATWVFYMAFEAYHTATKRRKGHVVDEFSSLIDVQPTHGRFPVGAILLIGLGFILLLDTTDIVDMEQLSRYWPVGLIVAGIYMLYNRVSGQRAAQSVNADPNAEARR